MCTGARDACIIAAAAEKTLAVRRTAGRLIAPRPQGKPPIADLRQAPQFTSRKQCLLRLFLRALHDCI